MDQQGATTTTGAFTDGDFMLGTMGSTIDFGVASDEEFISGGKCSVTILGGICFLLFVRWINKAHHVFPNGEYNPWTGGI